MSTPSESIASSLDEVPLDLLVLVPDCIVANGHEAEGLAFDRPLGVDQQDQLVCISGATEQLIPYGCVMGMALVSRSRQTIIGNEGH